MGLAPAPVNAWYLAWVALAPLWLLIRAPQSGSLRDRQRSFKEKFLLAVLWGAGYHGTALFWLTGLHPMTWMGVPWLASIFIALFCWIFVTLWGAALVSLWSILFAYLNQKLSVKADKIFIPQILFNVLLGVTLWCCLETVWSYGSLWWSSLSYTQSPSNLIILHLGQLSGFNAVTAALVIINGLLAEVVIFWQDLSRSKEKIIVIALPIFLFISFHLIGFYFYTIPIAKNDLQAIKFGIIQGNVPNEIKLYPEGWRKAIAGYTSGYKKLTQQGVDIVLTPETALPFSWKSIISSNSFYKAVLQEKVPALIGAFGSEGKSFTNSLFTLTGDGETLGRYDKYKLVPFGEYIPFESVLGKIINRLSPLDSHLAAGKSQQILETPFGQAIVGICYESAFADHFRRQTKAGGQFIITASNNAHYSDTMPAQHHAQDVMRAIESDRWAVRATNTGYSAIVDPRGHTIWLSDINEYEIHAETIYQRNNQNLYVRYGDWLTPLFLLSSILFSLVKLR
ncbi:MAG: apolipoprotein N-acyltransferase [Cyanobacteria bacterium P01_F01_bin.143]